MRFMRNAAARPGSNEINHVGRSAMNTIDLSLPEFAFVAATRGMAGAGVGLLVSDLFKAAAKRKAVGWTLFAIGALTTIPIAFTVARRHHAAIAG